MKGKELESRVAAYLRTHGYDVSTNVVREGRSGASHELDVVGRKADELTSFELVVECKAWESPIDKDVIYKLAAELADLGAAKGVIATLSGWTIQAGQAASQANIELWGPDELAKRFGELSLSEVHNVSTPVEALGSPFLVSNETAFASISRMTGGTFGIGREEVAQFGRLWLPLWSLQLGITRLEGLMKRTPRLTRVWNGYEALSGTCVTKDAASPALSKVNVRDGHIEPQLKAAQIEKILYSNVQRWRQSKTRQAKDRQEITLSRMGLKTPIHQLGVESATLTYFPLWVAILEKRDRERIVAVDGVTGTERRRLAEALTRHTERVRHALNS